MGPRESKGRHYQCNYGPGGFSGQRAQSLPQPWVARLAPPGSFWLLLAPPASSCLLLAHGNQGERAPKHPRGTAEFCQTARRSVDNGSVSPHANVGRVQGHRGRVVPTFDGFFGLRLLNSEMCVLCLSYALNPVA